MLGASVFLPVDRYVFGDVESVALIIGHVPLCSLELYLLSPKSKQAVREFLG